MKEALGFDKREKTGVKSITTNKKNKQLKVLGNKHNLHPLTNKNSPPSEGWIRPTGEDGVVKK